MLLEFIGIESANEFKRTFTFCVGLILATVVCGILQSCLYDIFFNGFKVIQGRQRASSKVFAKEVL